MRREDKRRDETRRYEKTEGKGGERRKEERGERRREKGVRRKERGGEEVKGGELRRGRGESGEERKMR